MKNNLKKWFTLVELLVVITILAIISVVAYQNFGWATGKAISWRKISDVSTIETSLEQYKVDKGSYPLVDVKKTDTNVFGYDSNATADPSNSFSPTKNGAEVSKTENEKWGWKIMWINTYSSKAIWAKWTISQETLGKQYLTKDLYDPELWDLKIWNKKAIEKWIGRYVYAVYKKPLDWATDYNIWWSDFNIAFTVKKDWTDDYITKIVWTYDKKSCYENSESCPETLIWSWNEVLREWDVMNWNSTVTNQWIPYPVSNF